MNLPFQEKVPDFLVVGHICHDKVPGGYAPGGAAAYAGLTGARLGFDTAVLTAWGSDFQFAGQFSEMAVQVVPSVATTLFENSYQNGHRVQYLHQRASILHPSHLPVAWRQAKTVLLGPICDEVSLDFIGFFENATVCVCPQGWMRQWDSKGLVSPKPLKDWGLLAKADLVSMSEADVGYDWDLIGDLANQAAILVVTQGAAGATVFENGKRHVFPAFPAHELDPTGAGDVFAAAFLLHFSHSNNLAEAAQYAHAAASLNVEGRGMDAIPTVLGVRERLVAVRGL